MYRAKDTFWVPGNRRIVKGDLVAETDPAVKGREALFEAVVIPQALADQEQATEPDPGEDLQKEPGPDGAEPTTPADAPEDASASAEEKTAPAPAKKTAAKKTTPAKRPTGGDAS